MAFNPDLDDVAITLTYLRLIKSSEAFIDKYSEPYLLSLAIDSSEDSTPAILYNYLPFPKVRAGGSVAIMGDGLLLYGPRKPGEFITLTVMFMESDRDVRNMGQTLNDIISSKAAELSIGAIVSANPGSAAMVAIIKELALYVSGALKKNGDDELFKIEGSFLKAHFPPYHINHVYEFKNDYIGANINIRQVKADELDVSMVGVINL